MTTEGNQEGTQTALFKSQQDIASAYQALVKGDEAMSDLERKLTSLENKLDAILGPSEQQAAATATEESGSGGKTSSASNGNSNDP